MLEFKTILCPTDFSPRADYAFQLACAIASGTSARLIVLHVAAAPPQVVPIGGPGVDQLQPASHRDGLHHGLSRYVCPDTHLQVEHRLEEGDPAKQIVRVASEIGCDLIVMGTHGRGGLGRLLLGSITRQVMRRAPCPVVTVKGPSEVQPRAAQSQQVPSAVEAP